MPDLACAVRSGHRTVFGVVGRIAWDIPSGKMRRVSMYCMAISRDPSDHGDPTPQYDQPGWQVHGPVINAQQITMVAPEPPAPAPDPNRAALLRRVRRQWVDGVLKKSLWSEARIALRLATDAARLSNVDLRAPEQIPTLLPPSQRIIEVYDQNRDLLLILGEPGGGKTTLLLELAEQLLDRAEVDATHPIPVVFMLSAWSKEQPATDAWMIAQLHRTYGVPKKIGAAWVSDGHILPLLDGLDEVAVDCRAACVAAINTYRGNHVGGWATPMVVCCRSEEYHTLPALQRAMTVAVQVLSHSEIDAYLRLGGRPLAGVRAVLKDDPTLYEMLKIPLFLSMITLAFVDTPAKELRSVAPLEMRRAAIFATFVRRMFAPDPPGKGEDLRYPRRRILRALRWLAQRLDASNLTLYLMELMQPNWVEGRWPRMAVRWSASLVLLVVGFFLGSIGGHAFGLVLAILGGVVGGMGMKTIDPTDALHWAWQDVRTSWWVVFAISLFAGLLHDIV